MVEQASTYINIDMARSNLFTFVPWNDNPYEGGFVPAHLKAAYQGSCVRISTKTEEMITKSSKL